MAIKLPEINLPGLSFLKHKESFAVDIGSHSIKIVHLTKNGSKYSLSKWAVLPINESGIELSPQERKAAISTKLAEFISKEKFQLKNVITSLSGSQLIVRYVKLPKLSREQLAKTIKFEAEPYIPFDINEVELGYHVIGDVLEDGQKKMDTILVAAKKEAMQAKLEILNELGLRPVILDIDVFALHNAFELALDPAQQQTTLLVNIGSTVSNMAIIENGIPRVVRDVSISGSSFTKSVQRNLGCDPKTAEELKTRYSLLVTAEEKEKTLADNQKEALQVSTALAPVAKELLVEIHRSIDFYVSQNAERNISKILLTGGSANLKNLGNYIQNELKITTELFNPLNAVSGGDKVPENFALQLAVAVGLAVRYENDVPKK